MAGRRGRMTTMRKQSMAWAARSSKVTTRQVDPATLPEPVKDRPVKDDGR